MKILKRISCALLASTTLCAAPAAFAQDTTVTPTTVIQNSIIADLNEITNIMTFNWGNGNSGSGTVIAPVSVIDSSVINRANIYTNVLSFNADFNTNDILGMLGY